MTDIIVTTPKNRMAEAAQEAEDLKDARGGYYYREYKISPPVKRGSRVYYVEDGHIRGFCQVDFVENDNGIYVMWMDATTWKWIKPIPMKGFQRWRYMQIPRERVKIIGGWLASRPNLP